MIRLVGAVWSSIRDHCTRVYPEEACGLLVGGSEPALTRVERIAPMENRLESSARARSFAVSDSDYARAERDAAAMGSSIVGVYHSHPDHPARPSSTDLEAALPTFSYLIVGVRESGPSDLRSYVLSAQRDRFVEEPVQFTSPPGDARGELQCP